MVALLAVPAPQRLEVRRGAVPYTVRGTREILAAITEALESVPAGQSGLGDPLDLLPETFARQEARITEATAMLAGPAGDPAPGPRFARDGLAGLGSLMYEIYDPAEDAEDPEEEADPPVVLKSSSTFAQSIVSGAGGGGIPVMVWRREHRMAEASELVHTVAGELGEVYEELHRSPVRAPRKLRLRCAEAARKLDGRLERLWDALSDFQGADLSGVTISLDDLDGVRWSDDTAPAGATAWPPALRAEVERHSPAVDGMPGVFEVQVGAVSGVVAGRRPA
ncbi:hypothetical protein ACQPZJ_50840 [Actinoplanes sp. CA-054009]